MKKQRVYLCIDQGMIWDAYSDMPVVLIIKNNDKAWLRYLDSTVDSKVVDEEEKLLIELKVNEVELLGLKEEAKKHKK